MKSLPVITVITRKGELVSSSPKNSIDYFSTGLVNGSRYENRLGTHNNDGGVLSGIHIKQITPRKIYKTQLIHNLAILMDLKLLKFCRSRDYKGFCSFLLINKGRLEEVRLNLTRF